MGVVMNIFDMTEEEVDKLSGEIFHALEVADDKELWLICPTYSLDTFIPDVMHKIRTLERQVNVLKSIASTQERKPKTPHPFQPIVDELEAVLRDITTPEVRDAIESARQVLLTAKVTPEKVTVEFNKVLGDGVLKINDVIITTGTTNGGMTKIPFPELLLIGTKIASVLG